MERLLRVSGCGAGAGLCCWERLCCQLPELSEQLAASPRASLSVKWSYQAKSSQNYTYSNRKAVLNGLSSNRGAVSTA